MISKADFFRRVHENSEKLVEFQTKQIKFIKNRIENQCSVKDAVIDYTYDDMDIDFSCLNTSYGSARSHDSNKSAISRRNLAGFN